MTQLCERIAAQVCCVMRSSPVVRMEIPERSNGDDEETFAFEERVRTRDEHERGDGIENKDAVTKEGDDRRDDEEKENGNEQREVTPFGIGLWHGARFDFDDRGNAAR